MESKSLSGLQQSNRIAEAAQTMRLEPTQGQVSFTNGYSESVIHDHRQKEEDVQCASGITTFTTMTLQQDLAVVKRTDTVTPSTGANSNACETDAIESDVLCRPVDVLRNGSSSELDVNLCHFSDSSGYSSERDSMPLFSVSETVPSVVALGPDLRNGLSASSSLQLSSAKTSDPLDNSVCQTIGSVCCKTGVTTTTRATSAPVATGCSDVIACVGATGVPVTRSCSDMAASTVSVQVPCSLSTMVASTASAPATSKDIDVAASAIKLSATGAPVIRSCSDIAVCTVSVQVPCSLGGMAASTASAPATNKNIDVVASATKFSATGAPVIRSCSDMSASTVSVQVPCSLGVMVPSTASAPPATSKNIDVVASVTKLSATVAPVTISCSDVAACTASVQVPCSLDLVVASTASAPTTSKNIDVVASATKLSAATDQRDIVKGGSTTVVCQAKSCVREALPQCISGQAVEKRKSTGDMEPGRARPSLNSKQRYSDVPVIDHGGDILPGNLDRDRHGSLLLPQEMQSPKKLGCEEKTKAEGMSSTVQSIPTVAVNAAPNFTGARSELAPERTLQEDPLQKKRYDRRSVTSISSDSRMEMRADLPPISPGCIVMSQSTEKITGRNNARVQFFPGGGIVRSSRSQENYFDSGDITCVDIDLDDNIASSVDALHYDTSSMASLDSMGVPDWPIDGSELDLSLQADDEKCFKSSEPDRASLPATLAPTTDTHSASTGAAQSGLSEIVLQAKPAVVLGPVLQSKAKPATALTSRSDDQRPAAGHGIALSINSREVEDAFGPQNRCAAEDVPSLSIPSSLSPADEPKPNAVGLKSTTAALSLQSSTVAIQKDLSAEQLSKATASACASSSAADSAEGDEDDDEEVARSEELEFLLRDESLFRQPTKDVDRPSAARLAKRLFYLHGFRKSDVSRHLSKKNSFSQLVGEEYLKYFDFSGEALDSALRRFMKHMTIYGETQDRERLLAHFSCRYQQCNPDIFKSEDCCHTLACALLLLNQDLNGPNIGRKITLPEFISNLADMNDGEQFQKELLKSFYQSIKNQPLEFEAEELHDGGGGSLAGATATAQAAAAAQPRFVSYNPFYEIPDPSNAVEFKKGYVMRKCCLEPDGRKTPLGKRGWKMFYATLRDMVLHLHIDEHGFKRNQLYTSATNAIHIHHSLATKATDYQKKNHVFRLQTADLAQYLIQTSDSKECQEWIDAINFVAASYSAPSPISSIASQKRFQRPLLPSTYSRLNLREQIGHHEKMIAEFDRELLEHRKNPPEKGAKTRLIQDYCKKENYLKFELKRYKTYCRLLQYKMSTFPELEPSLAEIAIGEVDELSLSGSPVESPFDNHGPELFHSLSADSQS